MTKIKDVINKEGIKKLHEQLDQLMECESGFVVIHNQDNKGNNHIWDYYQGICDHCVSKIVSYNVEHFYKFFGIKFKCNHK